MHIINDLEIFLKTIEETIHTYFGNGRAAEEGKDAIIAAVIAGGSPVISGTINTVKSKKATKEKEEPTIEEVKNV